MSRPTQPLLVRVTHWVNVPVLVLMAMSGLEILAAYPAMGPRGARYEWYPWNGHAPPAWLRLGDWLAGARTLHFSLAWLFVGNGILYLTYLLGSGEWRRRWFTAGLYNPLQRLTYLGVALLGVVATSSGLALYKPVQLRWLCLLFGGYDPARVVHLVTLAGLASFFVGHVLMVARHYRRLPEMITGGPPRA